MRVVIGAMVLGLALNSATACSHNSSKGPETTTTSGLVVGNEDAIQRLTKSRCDREQACNNIGAGKSYDTYSSCVNEMRHDNRADLRASECPHGVGSAELNACLHDITGEECGNPIDTITRAASCRKGKLCL